MGMGSDESCLANTRSKRHKRQLTKIRLRRLLLSKGFACGLLALVMQASQRPKLGCELL